MYSPSKFPRPLFIPQAYSLTSVFHVGLTTLEQKDIVLSSFLLMEVSSVLFLTWILTWRAIWTFNTLLGWPGLTELIYTKSEIPSRALLSISSLMRCKWQIDSASPYVFYWHCALHYSSSDGSYCHGAPADDPPYPDPHPGGYKGALTCGKYRSSKVISSSYTAVSDRLYERRQTAEVWASFLDRDSVNCQVRCSSMPWVYVYYTI